MSYTKAMKFNKRRNKAIQPCLSMPFEGLKQGQHIESGTSIAIRTATGYNVRLRDNIHESFIQVSGEFITEEEAIEFCDNNDLDNKHLQVRIYSTEGMHISGW